MIRASWGIACGVLLAGLVGPMVQSSAQADEAPATNPLSGNEAAIREGRSWYRNVCSVCHGGKADGAGDRGTAADLRVFNKGFRRFMQIVKEGKNTGRTMTMPAWSGALSEETMYQIGAYLETLALPGANWKEVSN
jgi:mono/diheme cytochrome c family protein